MNQPSRDELVSALNEPIERSYVLHEQALRNKHRHLLQLLENSEFEAASAFIEVFAREQEVQRVVVERERYQEAELDDVLKEVNDKESMEVIKEEWRRLLASGVPFDQLPIDANLPFLSQLYEQAKLDPTGARMRDYEKLERKCEDNPM